MEQILSRSSGSLKSLDVCRDYNIAYQLPNRYFCTALLTFFASLRSTFFLFVMSKLPPFPKDLSLHHQSEGEIAPKPTQELHEGLAFSLGKFLVYFGFSIYFLNALPIPFHFCTLVIYLFMPFFIFLILSH